MVADKIVGTSIRLIVEATFEATGCGGLRALPGTKNEFIYLRRLLLSQTLPKITLYLFHQLLPILRQETVKLTKC